jgi:hypothetical protein
VNTIALFRGVNIEVDRRAYERNIEGISNACELEMSARSVQGANGKKPASPVINLIGRAPPIGILLTHN